MRPTIAVALVMWIAPALLRAQGAITPTSACPAAGPGTEVPLGADSVRRTQRTDSLGGTAPTRVGSAPDIILRASVSAREVRFASQPHISVRLCNGTIDSVHVLERRNLPSPVVAGTTYRDVYVSVEILGHLTAECLTQSLGGARPNASGNACATLGIRDSAAAQRSSPARRPQ